MTMMKTRNLLGLAMLLVFQVLAGIASYAILVPGLQAEFARPDVLWWLLLVPVCEAVALGYWYWKLKARAGLGDRRMVEAMSVSNSDRRQIIRSLLMIAATTMFLIALAQPRWGQVHRTIKRSGLDIVFALDLSRSMLAQDVVPNRLKASKNEIDTALGLLDGDRVGLVVFTAVSFAQSPLTTDYGALRFYMRKLKPGQMPMGGTSIGGALQDALSLLTGEEDNEGKAKKEPRKFKRAKNQIIVLITDGEDHESDPMEAARAAKEAGVHVMTVGFGSERGDRIPVYREDGTLSGYKRNNKGEYVLSKLDTKSLREVANITGGTFVKYSGENSVANALVDYISALEKSELETLMRQRLQERFMWFLAMGLLCLLAALALGERKRGVRALHTMLVLSLLGVLGCEDAFRFEQADVAKGNEFITQEAYDKALKAYQKAGEAIPSSPELYFNQGRALLGSGDETSLNRAQEFFARAMSAKDDDLRLDAMYNLGLVLAAKEEWKESYETHKRALSLLAKNPKNLGTPRHKEIVQNLEYVFQKLYPPCRLLEDDMEENDTVKDATKLDKFELKDRTLCGLDDDWFAVPVLVGTKIEVKATFRDLREKPDPERPFLTRAEDLQLALYDGKGQQVLSIDQGDSDADVPFTTTGGKRTVTRHLAKFEVLPEMLPKGDSMLFVKVRATDELEFTYDLDITAIPPCSALDDKMEENDTRETARLVNQEAQQLHMCPRDEDWFKVEAELGNTIFVDIQPGEDQEKKAPPTLAMEILDPRGKVIHTGREESGFVTAGAWDIEKPGTYWVRVRGTDTEQKGPYTLQVYKYAPCPLGDDRYEDNDTPEMAAKLDAKTPIHRYLRVCPDEIDYFSLALPEPKKDDDTTAKGPQVPGVQVPSGSEKPRKLAMGISILSPPGKKGPKAKVSLDLLTPSGSQILLSSQIPSVEPKTTKPAPKGDVKKEKEEAPSVALDRVLHKEDMMTPEALLRVQGEPAFYHLVQLNPESPDQNQEEQNKDQEEQKDKQDQNQDDKNQDKNEPKEEPEDGNQGDKGDKNDENKEPEEEPKGDGQEEDKKSEEEEKEKKDAPPKDAAAQRMEDILKALENTDDNFQMRKALENMPRRGIEKDW